MAALLWPGITAICSQRDRSTYLALTEHTVLSFLTIESRSSNRSIRFSELAAHLFSEEIGCIFCRVKRKEREGINEIALLLVVLGLAAVPRLSAQQKKPNILFIMGDDENFWEKK